MTRSDPAVAVVGSFDTKGVEHAFLRDAIEDAGVRTVTVDFGIIGDPAFAPDVAAAEVALSAGTSLERLRARRNEPGARSEAINAMATGMGRLLAELHRRGDFDGVVGLGGGQGSTVISAGMRALPVGVPKLLVSTMAPMNIGLYFGHTDLTLMHAVTDIAGLNAVSRSILGNAARGIAGMARRPAVEGSASTRPLIGLTMFGTTTPGVTAAQEQLDSAGFDSIVFHAVGSGGAAMEDLIRAGTIDGVIDYTPSEVTDELLGGIFTAGPDRMTVAAERGLPQVLIPGALCQLTLGALDTVPPRFLAAGRPYVVHNPSVTVVRVDAADAATVGSVFAEKAATAPANVEVVLPLGGLSEYEQPGAPLGDPESDAALFDAIREHLPSRIPLHERDEDINDAAFARFVVDRFLALWAASGRALPTSKPIKEERP